MAFRALRTPATASPIRKRLPVSYSVGRSTDYQLGLSVELWTGGMTIAPRDLVPTGAAIKGRLRLPDGKEVRFHGVVRRCRLAGHLAVEFAGEPDDPTVYRGLLRDHAAATHTCKLSPMLEDQPTGARPELDHPSVVRTINVTEATVDMVRTRVGQPDLAARTMSLGSFKGRHAGQRNRQAATGVTGAPLFEDVDLMLEHYLHD